MKIRQANKNDAQLIANFQIQMAKETEDYDLNPETVNRGVRYVFTQPSAGFYIVAEDDEGKVCASTLVLNEWSDWRDGFVLWIHSVYVLPKYRGQGVFRMIYETLKEKVTVSNHYKGIRLYVEKDNEKAQKVYQKLGMTKDHYELYEWMSP